MIEELVEQIWQRVEFHADYRDLVLRSLRKSLLSHSCRWATNSKYDDLPDPDVLQRLLQAAGHFSASERIDCREAAYRIAIASWNLLNAPDYGYDNLRAFVHLILGRLGNFPALRFLNKNCENAEGYDNAIPLPVWLPLLAHNMANTVVTAGNLPLSLTNFQRVLWDRLTDGKSTAINAPTSAGKSFVLEHFLSSKTHYRRWAVYLVPTRALITQVSGNLFDAAREAHEGHIPVVTIPVPPEELGMSGGVYVLTQERLQLLLDADASLSFDLAVIDEAQMLAEPARGVILQTVIEEILNRSPNTQLLFAAPFAKDAGVFGQVFGIEVEPVPRPERPVAQNLIFVDSDSILRNRVKVGILLDDVRHDLGELILPYELFDENQALTTLSHILGAGDRSLIYAGGKARCEEIADGLRQLAENESGPDDFNYSAIANPERQQRLEELAAFVKQHVHPDYALATVIPKGIAFHYGNMPALIRKCVEELFSSGDLTHLVCTSTLLHGVNLPAKNLFLVNPTKGREWGTKDDIPISSLDFWNLAGRAGRLGKEFEGNVFLINYERWQVKPISEEREQAVRSSLTYTLVEQKNEFLQFVHDRNHPSGSNEPAENVLVKLVNAHRDGTLEDILLRAMPHEDEIERGAIASCIKGAAEVIDVPTSITEKNITVSVFRQQEMLDYLVRRIEEKGPRYVIPVHPAHVWDEAQKSLTAVFRRIHKHFEGKKTKSEHYFAPLALRWMKGVPLPSLIEDAIKYRRKKSPRARTATIIRNILDDIEQDLRFRYVKYTSCYHDLLIEALNRTNQVEFTDKVPPLALYLELGASSGTMISLVGLGLSRTTAGEISRKTTDFAMDRPTARKWLASQPWHAMDLSPICIREIQRVLTNSE